MDYRESHLDGKLRRWFQNDFSHAHLRSVSFEGIFSLRGVGPCEIPLDFPIVAIAGRNGTGKSTILASVCCGFHSEEIVNPVTNRRPAYYTFSDFFVQSNDEIGPAGIYIRYGIQHDKWRITKHNSERKSLGYQVRKRLWKRRWNNYDTRVSRDVVFLGIERVVPHSERSQSKSYRTKFTLTEEKGWEPEVCKHVSNVLGLKYDSLEYREHSKYRLPFVKRGSLKYSGFNMGAGESAVIEILSAIYAIDAGGLVVVDEIELGLHVEAQHRLIDELKQICKNRKTQVVCTTHSPAILERLPMDARILIEKSGSKTLVKQGPSTTFTSAKLAGTSKPELTVFVEDSVAKRVLNSALPLSIRQRLRVEDLGSSSLLVRA
ncbi:MAG: putative ATPase [Verrucomicrobiales bacterium]|jgi:predicted ATPase